MRKFGLALVLLLSWTAAALAQPVIAQAPNGGDHGYRLDAPKREIA